MRAYGVFLVVSLVLMPQVHAEEQSGIGAKIAGTAKKMREGTDKVVKKTTKVLKHAGKKTAEAMDKAGNKTGQTLGDLTKKARD